MNLKMSITRLVTAGSLYSLRDGKKMTCTWQCNQGGCDSCDERVKNGTARPRFMDMEDDRLQAAFHHRALTSLKMAWSQPASVSILCITRLRRSMDAWVGRM